MGEHERDVPTLTTHTFSYMVHIYQSEEQGVQENQKYLKGQSMWNILYERVPTPLRPNVLILSDHYLPESRKLRAGFLPQQEPGSYRAFVSAGTGNRGLHRQRQEFSTSVQCRGFQLLLASAAQVGVLTAPGGRICSTGAI